MTILATLEHLHRAILALEREQNLHEGEAGPYAVLTALTPALRTAWAAWSKHVTAGYLESCSPQIIRLVPYATPSAATAEALLEDIQAAFSAVRAPLAQCLGLSPHRALRESLMAVERAMDDFPSYRADPEAACRALLTVAPQADRYLSQLQRRLKDEADF